MILRDMITRIQDRVGDSVYWNDKRIIALLNEAKNKLAQEVKFITQQFYEFDSVKGQQKYQVPSALVRHHYLYYNSTYNKEIKLYDDPRDIYGVYTNVFQEGLPERGYIWGESGRRELTIYPTFNSDGIELKWWFYGWPIDLANDNDEPSFPVEWHPSLIEYAKDQAKVDDKEISVGDALLLWKDEIRKIKSLDVTISLLESSEKQYGTVESHFPRIGSGGVPFTIASEGTVW